MNNSSRKIVKTDTLDWFCSLKFSNFSTILWRNGSNPKPCILLSWSTIFHNWLHTMHILNNQASGSTLRLVHKSDLQRNLVLVVMNVLLSSDISKYICFLWVIRSSKREEMENYLVFSRFSCFRA